MNLLIYRYHVSKLPQRTIPKFHLNFWCEIFVEAHSFRTLSSNFPKNSAETVNFHRIYAQRNKVKLRYFMQCLLSANVFVAISSQIDSCILTLHSYPAPFFPSHCYLSGHDQIFIDFYCFSPGKCVSTDFLFDPSLIGLPYLVFLFFV